MTPQSTNPTTARFSTLAEWLCWQESLNPRGIELGLERIKPVAERLRLSPIKCPLITVGGTNGKGSCVALLEAMLGAQGYRVCTYTSPHLLRYNERMHIAGQEASDAQLCSAFERIDAARGDIPLTYFEFGTLAALMIFQAAGPQAIILEVGLGGRLDAVNLMDADLALVTSIGIDHTEWLGGDRNSIGREKAGIFRPGRPAVCGDPQPPQGLLQQAEQIGARLYQYGPDFSALVNTGEKSWEWRGWGGAIKRLPQPVLRGPAQIRNAAVCIAGLKLLEPVLPVSEDSIRAGLRNIRLAGRFQQLDGDIPVILDVAHNAEACQILADNLQTLPCKGNTLAVMGMLRGKPAADVANIMDDQVHAWYLGGLQAGERTQSAKDLARELGTLKGSLSCHTDITEAFAAAKCDARPEDRIVVFGSFLTVEAILRNTA